MQHVKKLIAPLILAVGVVGLAVAWWQRWAIHDYLRLRNYNPPSRVVQLAEDTTMNQKTRRLFYVYYPSLEDKSTFRQHCPTGEVTIVLGCYVSGQGIFLADITDDRLAGVMEVTAAHEVLHAAYERLDGAEKARIGKLLNQALKDVKSKRIQKNIDEYKNNGSDLTNELHSILGTEVRKLPKELEQYYSQYFEDRSRIVGFSEQYEAAFTDLKDQVAAYDEQLESLQAQIKNLEASLATQQSGLTVEQARLDQLLANNQAEAYNAAVPGFNQLVNKYNADVGILQGLIDQYNNIVKRRNDLAVQQGELIEAIDSRPQTIEQ